MRELLKGNLRRSLQAIAEIDRLAAAWPVVCGSAMAAHGEVVGFTDGVVSLEVSGEDWMRQIMSMQGQIVSELGKVAGVRVSAIHFERKRTAGPRGSM